VGIEADGRKSWKAEVVREEATEAREAAQRATEAREAAQRATEAREAAQRATEAREAAQRATEAREAAQDEVKRLRIEAARKAEAESLEAIRMEIRNARARDRQIQEDAPLYFEAVKDLLKGGCQPVRRPTEYDKDIEKWTFWAFLNREQGGPLRNLIGAKDTDGPLKIRGLFDFDLRGFTNFQAFKRDAFQENPYLENDLNRHSEFAETILQAGIWADIAEKLDDWGRALLVQTGELFCKLASKLKAPTFEPKASTPKPKPAPEPEPPQYDPWSSGPSH
jgi:flagellar biosynthesis GTPase FlhF